MLRGGKYISANVGGKMQMWKNDLKDPRAAESGRISQYVRNPGDALKNCFSTAARYSCKRHSAAVRVGNCLTLGEVFPVFLILGG